MVACVAIWEEGSGGTGGFGTTVSLRSLELISCLMGTIFFLHEFPSVATKPLTIMKNF